MKSLVGQHGLAQSDSLRKRDIPLDRLFDDALDELEITYDVYYRIDLYRPRSIHIADWLLRKGLNNVEVLVLSVCPRPMTMLLGKLGVSVTERCVRVPGELRSQMEKGVVISDLSKVLMELPGDFDVIVCDDLMQHFPSPRATLAMLTRRLRTNGVLVLIAANVVRGTARVQLLRGKNIYPWISEDWWWNEDTDEDQSQDILPYREYTLREVQAVVSDLGLQVLDSGYLIGKKSIDANQASMSVVEYVMRKLSHAVQVVIPPLRSHFFVALGKSSVGARGG